MSQTAIIDSPRLDFAGDDVVINDDAFTPPDEFHKSGELLCTGMVVWNSGTFRPVINVGDDSCDVWHATGNFIVDHKSTFLAPGTVNGIANKGDTFLFIEGETGILSGSGSNAAFPPFVFPNVYKVITDGQLAVRKWFFETL